jgi:cation diffusion facilitator family transporter
MKTERRGLILSAVMSLVLGSVALVASVITGSQVILLDGLFNLIYSVMAFFSVRVATLLAVPDNEKYPFGFAYFESLVNAAKGLLILGVGLLALGDSVLVLLAGGREITAEFAIVYAVFATAASLVSMILLGRVRRHTSSPLVEADYANWRINTTISASVLIAFCLIPVANMSGWSALTPYVDPLMVAVVVVLFCLSAPFRMASEAIKELLNRAPPSRIRHPVQSAVEEVLGHWPVSDFSLRMVRPGRTLYLVIYVVLPEDSHVSDLKTLDRLREQLDNGVRAICSPLILDVVFTADSRWVVPTNGYQ